MGFVANFVRFPAVQIFWKSVKIWQGYRQLLECGPMPNMMVALLNIGGALCSMPQSLV